MRAFEQRIQKVKNFKEIFDKGIKYKTHSSQIILLLQKSQTPVCNISLGVLALKKIVGKKAVHRNKVKRRFKHGLLSCLRTGTVEKGFDIKLIALTNKNTLNCDWQQILSDINKEIQFINKEILRQEGLLNAQDK